MSSPERLQIDQCYHIYYRGINGKPLFREERNHRCFLKPWAKYVEPVAETYAYCLLNNHFDFLVRIKETETGPISEVGPVMDASRQFNNLFIAYANAFNKAYQRTGGLFESPFKRQIVDNDCYFTALVAYIHRNPQMHGFVDDFRNWPYSSDHAILSSEPFRIQRVVMLDWFEGHLGFQEMHISHVDEAVIEPLFADDWM